jgi:hypothetical protein
VAKVMIVKVAKKVRIRMVRSLTELLTAIVSQKSAVARYP